MDPRQCPRATARVWVARLGTCNENDLREARPAQLGPEYLRGSQKGMESFPCLTRKPVQTAGAEGIQVFSTHRWWGGCW